MMNKITPYVDLNEMFGHSTNELNNQNSIKVPKVIEPTYKKWSFKTLGTSVINSPMSTPSPDTIILVVEIMNGRILE